MINIVLFGPPGAGKGTHSQPLTKQHDFVHLAPGDIFRAAIKQGTPLGKQAEHYVEQGLLTPDKLVIALVNERIASHQDPLGFIFDGYPRTIAQAEALDQVLHEMDAPLQFIFFLDVTEQSMKERIIHRREKQEQIRKDDKDMEMIARRIAVYRKKTAPVLEFYEKQGRLTIINGERAIPEVFKDIYHMVNPLLRQKD